MKIKRNRGMGTTRVGVVALGGLVSAWLAAGCANADGTTGGVQCGEGTVEEDGFCVPEGSSGSGGNGGSGAGSNTGGGAGGSGGECAEEMMEQPCYGGPAGTQGVGACQVGTQICSGGSFGACMGEVTPGAESCNGIDDDCNGAVDDNCSAIGVASYQTAPGYFDAVLDTERHQIFLSYGGSGTVHVINLADGADKVVTTGWKAEHMHFDPILDQVAISLPSGEHSAYWWDEDQEGYVAAIDAVTLADPTPIWIPLDPWQIVSDGTGHVYAAGASGQWTSAIAVNLATGWSALSGGSVRNGTSIRLHPSLNRIYGADTGLSPSDIERWDIGDGKIGYSYDSPYHGDYPMCGDLRLHPAGNTIYTKCGHVFLASDVMASDMTWVASMGLTWGDLTFHPTGSAVYAITEDAPTIYEYDPATLAPVTTHPLSTPAQRILAGPTYLVVLRNLLGGNPKTEIEVIPYADL